MIRNLKALGLALVALVAMSALFSSAASAGFESEAETTTLTATALETQKFQVKAGGLTIQCNTITLDSSTQTSKKTTTVTVSPTYTNCLNLIGVPVSIHSNGCKYVFHSNAGSTTGTTDVECEGTKGIEITIGSLCTYKIDTQTGLSAVNFKNKGAGTTREVELEPVVNGITSTLITNDSILCTAASNEGTYRGKSLVTGENAGVHVGVFVD